MSNKRVRSNVYEVKRGFEDVEENFKRLDKTYESTEESFKTLAKKTNAGIFNELASIVEGHRESIKQIRKLNGQALEAADHSHKRMSNVVGSFDL